jgi:hypothetical protein
MMAVEERLAHVEGLVAGQSQLLGDVRTSLTNFEARVDQRFTIVEGRLAALDQKIDTRCDALEQRLGARIDALDSKIGAVEGQLHRLDDAVKSSAAQVRRDMGVMFGWTMAGVIAIMATVAAAAFTR